jgi:hypothetical protein
VKSRQKEIPSALRPLIPVPAIMVILTYIVQRVWEDV